MSSTSPATGVVKSSSSPGASPAGPGDAPFRASRGAQLLWTGAYLAAGVFLFLRAPDVARVLALLLVALGVRGIWLLLRAHGREPGGLHIVDSIVSLPARPYEAGATQVPLTDVQAAYVVSRAGRAAGATLVVETRQGTFEYPRSWFVEEDAPRKMARELNRRLERL